MPESQPQSSMPERKESRSNGGGQRRTVAGLDQKFVDTLGWIITVAWGFSMILHALNIGYEPPASIHLLMMVVAGTAFGTNFVKPKDGDDSSE